MDESLGRDGDPNRAGNGNKGEPHAAPGLDTGKGQKRPRKPREPRGSGGTTKIKSQSVPRRVFQEVCWDSKDNFQEKDIQLETDFVPE